MIERTLESTILKYREHYPLLAIVGPRQSGKTTLATRLFPDYTYVSLENIDNRTQALNDPRGFLNDFGPNTIFDEIQRAPDLFSYLQEKVDFNSSHAQYILTGSQQFLLLESISQSLAGRVATFKLFPFTWDELSHNAQRTTIRNITFAKEDVSLPGDIDKIIFTGFYPRIHDRNLEPRKWLENYVRSYVERDVRLILQVADLGAFESFLALCASYSGSILNYTSISNAVGISQPTIKRWISILETSGIVFLLKPYHNNFGKRIIKSPKLYFSDSGLLCFLLGIRSSEDLRTHPLRGNIFETFIISELMKRYLHLAEIPPLYFWRDKTGNEIDVIIEEGQNLFPIEIKSSQTWNASFSDTINKWRNLKGNNAKKGLIIYTGERTFGSSEDLPTIPWQNL